jgi:hypothetical protein
LENLTQTQTPNTNWVPETQTFFEAFKSFIPNPYSLVQIIRHLDPFSITSKDLSYFQYKSINSFVWEKISEYNKGLLERGRVFLSIRQPTLQTPPTTQNISLLHFHIDKQVYERYDCVLGATNTEILACMIRRDQGALLTSALGVMNLPLTFSESLNTLFEQYETFSQKNNKKEKKRGEQQQQQQQSLCRPPQLVAKKYLTREELEADNNTEYVFFDKEYDTTPYGMLESFEKEMSKMEPSSFFDFLVKNIQKKTQFKTEEEAIFLAKTLLMGKKKVREGDFAVLYHESDDLTDKGELFTYLYFKRVGNQWMDDHFSQKTTDPLLLCELQNEDCFSTSSSNCESLTEKKRQIHQSNLETLLRAFDETFETSSQEWETVYQDNLLRIGRLDALKTNMAGIYNDQKVRLGFLNDEVKPQLISPFAPVRDLILGQTDFVKKQMDIVLFCQKFTKEAQLEQTNTEQENPEQENPEQENPEQTNTEQENPEQERKETPNRKPQSPYWLYCIETSTPLIPVFLNKLAQAFLQGFLRYNQVMNQIIKEIGKKSDDGDYWVDEHSGYVIQPVDLSTEEGYTEEGHKIKTHDVLMEDINYFSKETNPKETKPKGEKEQMIEGVVNTLSSNMGIHLEPNDKEFIQIQVIQDLESLFSSKKMKETSYQDLILSRLFFSTLCLFLIVVQTHIPSFKTAKVFPGCVKSFSLSLDDIDQNDQENSKTREEGLRYIACVANKSKSPIDPWKSIMKQKEETIMTTMKKILKDSLLSRPEISRKIKEKKQYLIELMENNSSEGENNIPDDHSLQKQWLYFLPPLVPFQIFPPQPLTTTFKTQLKQDMAIGSGSQREKLLVISSKSIAFALSLQEKIQTLLNKKRPLLRSALDEPFIQNACCNDAPNAMQKNQCIDYFNQENPGILMDNEMVIQLQKMLKDVEERTRPPFLFCRENDKNQYPSLSNTFNEYIIYKAFVVFCQFQHPEKQVPSYLMALCNQKPDFNVNQFTFQETLAKLKGEGRVYTHEALLHLLQLVGKQHMQVLTFPAGVSPDQQLLQVVEKETLEQSEEGKTSNNTITELERFLRKNIDSKDFKNHLGRWTKEKRTQIKTFIETHSSLNPKKIKALVSLESLEGLGETWNLGEANVLAFLKQYVHLFVHVYPTILLHRQEIHPNIVKHWDLSEYHSLKLQEQMMEAYKALQPFYDNLDDLRPILERVQVEEAFINNVIQNTPFSPPFDKRLVSLMFEYGIWHVFSAYMESSINPEEREEDISMQEIEKRMEREGSLKGIRIKVANLLAVFLMTMKEHKNLVNKTELTIMDRILALKGREKTLITDRLKKMTDEERKADTILKMNKLGVWSKGLQKGLTQYVKSNYDNEREFIANLHKGQEGQDPEDLENLENEEAIDRENYDMTHMDEDYTDGDPYGEENNDYNNDYE